MSFLINPFVYAGFDPDAQAFITSAGITDNTQKTAINTLVIDLKGYGIWSKMKAIYPFVGGTASTHKWNLKDPRDLDAAFRLVFFGGWTHSSTGAKPNGTNGYANTYLSPNSIQLLNSNGLGCYITQNSSLSSDPITMGGYNVGNYFSILTSRSTSLIARLNNTAITSSITGGNGSFDAQKTSLTLTTLYKNGTSVGSGNSGGALPFSKIYLGSTSFNDTLYGNGLVNSEFRLAYMSDGLNSTEIGNLRTAVQTFQTTLNRQI